MKFTDKGDKFVEASNWMLAEMNKINQSRAEEEV